MFGHQRVGDLTWAAGDIQAKGFLLGATSGRTTLNGEGLQHQDGHSHILAGTVPNQRSYDPTYSYEVAVIVQHGLKQMYDENQSVFYYITLMNENYPHLEMPEGIESDIIKGMYLLKSAVSKMKNRVRLLGSGTILREVEAAEMLAEFGVGADVYSATSFNEFRRDGQSVARYNLLHPERKQHELAMSRQCLVARMLRLSRQLTICSCTRSRFDHSWEKRPTSRWVPMVLAAQTHVKSCVSISRSIVDLSLSPHSVHSRWMEKIDPKIVSKAIKGLRHRSRSS